jgi:phosphoglucosamine mutase
MNCSAGIMISASHNPAEDNGIKIFDKKGFKLGKKEENRIERAVNARHLDANTEWKEIGKAFRVEDARGRYIEFVKGSIQNQDLSKLKIVLDCANGAAYRIAPRVFQELGARVTVLNNKPDGYNINHQCGALFPQHLQRRVRKEKADFGIALDGDADRCIVVDERGKIQNGDQLLALFAKNFVEKGMLKEKKIVTTVMANAALDEEMQKNGIAVVRVSVGDKNVIAKMLSLKANLGGEPSGHLVFGDHLFSADGTLCGIQLAAILAQEKKHLSALCALKPYPQVLVNVPVKHKKPLEKLGFLQQRIRDAEKELGRKGRVLVRYSGTEKAARIMVEGKNKKQIQGVARQIAGSIQKELGT